MQSVFVPHSSRAPVAEVRKKIVLMAPMACPSGVRLSRRGMMATLKGMVTEAPMNLGVRVRARHAGRERVS